ncbi:glycosyltransferase family 2 protein [Planctomicrobium sp. SH664]|uniref:glycosyltransferase family 2 protein n=1 Tax=Planctomicrobium sp. SH664 TaxID=3448125 RepID=UPI003F5B2679
MLSIVIPLLDEEDSLRELYDQICKVCTEHEIEVEMIFVDDGSIDRSWEIVQGLAQQDSRVFGIRLRRNFGKAAALTAGLNCVRGELVMMIDADLQDDPAEIPRFLEKIEAGFDVVNGWKRRRLDPWHKVYPSRVFNLMVSRLTGLKLHDHNCGIKMFRAQVARELRLYGELHRFIPVLAHARGFKVTESVVHHRPRQFGHSKYGFGRFLRGFLDLLTVKFLTAFGQRPLHLLGGIGVGCFAVGLLGMFYCGGLWFLMNVLHLVSAEPIGSRPLLLYSIAALLLGAQVISLGLLGELIVANTATERDTYSVAERTPLRDTAGSKHPAQR